MAKGPRPLNSEAFVIQVGRACRIHHPSGVCAPNLPAFARACTFMVCMCADWTSRYPFAVSGRRAGGSWGKGAGTAVSIIRLGSCSGSGGGLAGRMCFCSWLSLDPPAISRMLCSVAVSGGTWPTRTVSDLGRKKTGMERSDPTLSPFLRAGWPGGSGIGAAPTAAAERHRC